MDTSTLTLYEDPTHLQEDMKIMQQNVRSFALRKHEVELACAVHKLDHVVLLECQRRVEWLHFDYRHNSNLFKSPVGRNSSGILIGANSPIQKVRNPIGDFVQYKVDNVWFMVLHKSKNNTATANQPPPGDFAGGELDDELEEEPEANNQEESADLIQQGCQQILKTKRNLFLTQNQVVLMSDWNVLKDYIVGFMEDLQANRLDIATTYTAVRNRDITHYIKIKLLKR